ncbi:MAG TPA: hypothetical protein VNB06_21330 [Thermoanaerobaculia bacterium]|nr:hypothetical protein [Thermoanaerobaculia bacterium]
MTRPLWFLVDRRDPGTLRDWLANEGRAVAGSVAVLTYQELLRRPVVAAGVCVFCDFDCLTSALRPIVREAWVQLESAGVRLLNDPRRALDRRQLLERLASLGRNDFRAFPVDGVPADVRFPVFVRRQSEHDGPQTSLLHDRESLCEAIQGLTWPFGPHRRADLLVVEFCNTSVDGGPHSKYAATRVGERLLNRHIMFSNHWSVKHSGVLIDAEMMALERRYLASNPYREWVLETFELAGVDYGRLDFGICDGRPQAFEINTNPTMGPRPGTDPEGLALERARQGSRWTFHQRFYAEARHALRALARSRPVRRVELRFAPMASTRYRLERLRHFGSAAWRLGWSATLRHRRPASR